MGQTGNTESKVNPVRERSSLEINADGDISRCSEIPLAGKSAVFSNGVNQEEIHLALVISGAVSLGTYEAGVLVKLISAVRKSQKPGYQGPKLIIDVIAGASAGAMTGSMVAYCLLYGVREDILYQVWVEEIDIRKLENKFGKKSVLSSRQIEALAEAHLKNPLYWSREYRDSIQEYPVRLVISLTNLNGNSYAMPVNISSQRQKKLDVFTYRDGRYYDLEAGKWDKEVWESIRKAAVASGAFPVAFEPVKMKNRREVYLDNSFSGESFYTDGGVLNNRPLGMAIDAAFNPHDLGKPDNLDVPLNLNAGDKRYFILIQPEMEKSSPFKEKESFNPVEVGFNSLFTIPRHQSLYDDLRKLNKINNQIVWEDSFLSSFKNIVGKLDRADLNDLEKLLKEKCREILDFKKDDAIKKKKPFAEKLYNWDEQEELKHEGEPKVIGYLRLYINLIGRLRGKQKVDVVVITPADEYGKEKDILAGEFLMHFGGFLSFDLRKHDFIIGYRRARDWLVDMGWDSLAQEDDTIKRKFDLEYDGRLGEMSFGNLPYSLRVKGYFTGIKIMEVLFSGFSQKSAKFNTFLNLIVGFLKLLAYPLAIIGKGFWIVLAFVIFIIGLKHSVGYLWKLFFLYGK